MIDAAKKFLTTDEHELFAMQVRRAAERKKQFSEEFKTFAVSVYYKSPACYQFLQSRFKLPGGTTINHWMSSVQTKEGHCPNLLRLLEVRVQRLKP